MATKRAVCVGINYPGTDAALSGCVNDANDWAELLHGAGYSELSVLLDAAATKVAILSALRDEVARLGWGDRLVFTYSGHGTWVPDTSGDETDRRDEALCPIDFTAGQLITDDELEAVFSAVPRGASALIISDSCHSGSLSRFAGPGLSANAKPRFVSPASFTAMSEDEAKRVEETTTATPPRGTASLISGCADTEFSYDAWFGPRANGAMSRAAIDTYRLGISLSAWHKAIRSALPSADYPQSPQLTASSLYRKYTRAL